MTGWLTPPAITRAFLATTSDNSNVAQEDDTDKKEATTPRNDIDT
ncbi:hypothetical protein [Marivita cryptomonadis]|nr:hypothetical protein [Marivita cryptomonadis]